MKPLTLLIEANLNFYKLEQMIGGKQVLPEFRYKALEEEFCKFFTGICEILKEFGTLKNHFDIRQMLSMMKIDDWKNIRPFEHYVTPLNDSVNTARDTMRAMGKLGHLRIKYVVEKNEQLAGEIDAMVMKDNVVQVLMGNELKQDQFKFFYDVMKIIFDSALQKKLYDLKKEPNTPCSIRIEKEVIPQLIAYHSLMRIRNIQMRKYDEAKKAKEKAEAMGLPPPEEKKDPTQMTEEEIY